ncbi:MAG: ATP-dependent helicase HrpB [Thiomicrorhabdus sp.]|nr:MAG: ATP-dependent helicase HrpB [Thiomicrorhabdus sp.]
MPKALDLPITAFLPEIVNCLKQNTCCILQAEPGAGKSTQVPLALLDAEWLNGRKIILLEPRRLAVRALANFLASQLSEPVGQRIGYQVRNDNKTSKQTVLEIMTEGVLIRRLQQDPELADTALIIFDEFHERSLDTDLALALCLDSQAALREDLKILVMSATIESKGLSQFLEDAPVIQCPGRTFPVDIHYQKNSTANQNPLEIFNQLNQTLTQALNAGSGDCLVFLPGQKEIFRAISNAAETLDEAAYAFIPLYGGLSPDAQNKALQKDHLNRRKIIFSTNIAETSLTIENIHIVIDSGQVRKSSYDSSSGMTRMLTEKISQASAIQRSGRAGRLASGTAYRLWTEAEHKQRAPFESEAILNSDLTDLALEVALWGESSPYHLRWLTAPPKAHYEIAKTLLIQLGFLSPKGHATQLGQQATNLGLSCRLAKMLLAAANAEKSQSNQNKHGQSLLQTACQIAAILSERDLFKTSYSANLLDRLQALQAFDQNPKQAARDYPLIVSACKEALTNSHKWLKRLNKGSFSANKQNEQGGGSSNYSIAQLLALAYPDRVAKRRSSGDIRYQLSNGKGAFLLESDPLVTELWLVIAHLDGQRRDGRIFMACPISFPEIESIFEAQITELNKIEFDSQKQRIIGETSLQLGSLSLKKKPLKNLSKTQIQDCIIKTIKDSKLKRLPWHKKTLEWLNRVKWLGQYLPEYDIFSEQTLIEEFDEWCAPYLSHLTSWADLAKLDLLNLLKARLPYELLQKLDKNAPLSYTAPSNKMVAIEYHIGKQPSVAIQLQELFGEVSSPKLAGGKVSLTFELLSPARHPIQITSDLAHFWQNSYIEVAKDMRGRYKRHRWPEKPLEEKAGRSIQPRKRKK